MAKQAIFIWPNGTRAQAGLGGIAWARGLVQDLVAEGSWPEGTTALRLPRRHQLHRNGTGAAPRIERVCPVCTAPECCHQGYPFPCEKPV